MCIIIAKDKTNRLPSKKELEYCFDYNHDGAGFMYTDNGKVIIDKGYMTKEDFLARFKTLCNKYNNFKGKSLVIHCRIGTAGSNSQQNTHPYALTKKINKLHKIYTKASVGIAHNGIISDYQPEGNKDINDTQNFIRTYMVRKYKEDKSFYKRRYERDLIEDMTNSKFAILDKDDNLYLIGTYIKEDNLSFSNTHYKPYTYKYNASDYRTYTESEYYKRLYDNSYWNDRYYDEII